MGAHPYQRRAGVKPKNEFPNREIDRVMDAYDAGCRTTSEVALETGFSVKKCSAYSRALVESKMLKMAGLMPKKPGVTWGRRECIYEPGNVAAV
jgi:hypothetical protein